MTSDLTLQELLLLCGTEVAYFSVLVPQSYTHLLKVGRIYGSMAVLIMQRKATTVQKEEFLILGDFETDVSRLVDFTFM